MVRFDVQDVTITTMEDTAIELQVPVVANRQVQATVSQQPAHGTVSQTDSVTYRYTPAPDFNGQDTIGITYTDGTETKTGTAHITVTPVNDAPVAGADSFAAGFATSLQIDPASLLANDHDIDSSTLTVTSVTPGTHGGVTMAGGMVTFTAEAAYQGPATFTYQVSDGEATAFGNVTVTVGANGAPVATGDTMTTNEDTPATVTAATLLANDSDPDSQTLVISSVDNATHGTVAQQGTNITFTPDANYNGAASFSYTITDGASTATAAVTISVASVNDAPVANDDTGIVGTEDGTLVITKDQLLGNDSDVDNDALTITAVSNATNGVAALPASAVGDTVTFTPAPNYHGPASFDYTVSDGTTTATGHVTLNITNVNDAPVAVDDAVTGFEDMQVVIAQSTLLGNDTDADGDTLTITQVTNATHGTVSTTGMIVFTPAPNYAGPASFDYVVTDGLMTDTGTVNLTIMQVNDAPVAVDDAISTGEDTPVTSSVLANDTDIDSPSLVVAAVTQGAHGTVTFTASGVTYSPAANYSGTDSFTYTASDGAGGMSVATVAVTVTPVNDAPTTNPDTLTVMEDGSATIDPRANDSDAEGDPLTITAVGTATHGTVTLTGGIPLYAPAHDYNGNDSFTYTVSDGQGGNAIGTVSVVVMPVNDAPVALAERYRAQDGVTLTVPAATGVLANDTDVDMDPLRAVLDSDVDGGTLVLRADGSFDYTPDTCAAEDCFTYQTTDGVASSEIVQVCFDINHAPAPRFDLYYAYPGETLQTGPCFGQLEDWSVLCNDDDIDGDPIVASIVTPPSHALAFQFNSDGTFSYTPDENFAGQEDVFFYQVSDGFLTTQEEVDIEIECPNTVASNGNVAFGTTCGSQIVRPGADGVKHAVDVAVDGAKDVGELASAVALCSCGGKGSAALACDVVHVGADTSAEQAGDLIEAGSRAGKGKVVHAAQQ